MTRSATDVMHDVIYAAVIDAIGALKSGAGNLPNTILRDLNAIHANTTYPDLPEGVRKAIEASVRAAFTRLHKEGYSVSSAAAAPPRPAGPRPEGLRREGPRRDGPRRDGPRGGEGKPSPRRPGGGPAGTRPPRKPGGPKPR